MMTIYYSYRHRYHTHHHYYYFIRVGGLSVINAIAGSYSDDLPIICISGGPNTVDSYERHLVHHTIGEKDLYQQSKCFEPVVAKCFVIKHVTDASQMIDEAILLAMQKKKPVYLEVPVNLSTVKIDYPIHIDQLSKQNLLECTTIIDSSCMSSAIEDIGRSIRASVKPVIIAGSKLRKMEATKEFLDLANAMGSGVAVMPDAKGLFPECHPSYMGRYWGSVSMPYVAEVVQSSDLVVMVGPVLNDYTTTGWSTLLPTEKIISIDCNAVTVGHTHYPNVPLKALLARLVSVVPRKDASLHTFQRYKGCTNCYKDMCGDIQSEQRLSLRYLKCAVEQTLTAESTILTETGDSWFVGQKLTLPEGAKYMVQMQYGSIGWSVGAVLGVALAEGTTNSGVSISISVVSLIYFCSIEG